METKSWGLLMLIINIFFPGIGSIIAGLKGASSRCTAACCAAPLPRRRPRTLTGPLRHHPPVLRARVFPRRQDLDYDHRRAAVSHELAHPGLDLEVCDSRSARAPASCCTRASACKGQCVAVRVCMRARPIADARCEHSIWWGWLIYSKSGGFSPLGSV